MERGYNICELVFGKKTIVPEKIKIKTKKYGGTMDWEIRLIELYLLVEKYYQSELWIYSQRFSNNNQPKITDAEIITVFFWGLFNEYFRLKQIHSYCLNHLKEWFPDMPAYPTYVTRLNRLDSVLEVLILRLQKDAFNLKGLCNIGFIDAMPIIMAKGGRRYLAKAAPELADCGYCASKKLHYYGVKLHVLGIKRDNRIPIPDYIAISRASEHDLNILKELADELNDVEIYADKAYCSLPVEQELKERGVEVFTPVKRKKGEKELRLFQRAFSTLVSQVRQPIESFFNWIEEKTHIQRASKVLSAKGLLVHIFGRLAFAFLLLFIKI
jgi:IS5 family transposase